MLTVHDLLAGFLLPMILSAGGLVVGWRSSRHMLGARDSRSAFGPLAIGLGYIAGWIALFGWGAFPPADSTNWLFFLAFPLVAFGALDAWFRAPLPSTILVALIMVPVATWLIARPLWNMEPPGFDGRGLTITGFLGISWVLAMDSLAARISARRACLILLLAIAPASLVVILSGHSQKLGQVGGLLTATLTGAVIAGLILGRAGVGRGIMLLTGILFGGILLCGHLYSTLGLADALLLYLAPVLAWLPLPFERRFGVVPTALGQSGLVLVPTCIALARALIEFSAHAAEY